MQSPTNIDRRDLLTVRQYAARKQITLGTAYRRIWAGQVEATQFLGRWLINDVKYSDPSQASRAARLKYK